RYPLLDIIDAKINVNSRASAASPSRVAILLSLDRFPLIAGIAGSLWLLCGKSLLASENLSCLTLHQLQSSWPQQNRMRELVVEFHFLLGIWSLGSGICGRYSLLRRIGKIVGRDQS